MRVYCGGQTGQAFKESGSRGVEVLVGDAEDTALLDGCEVLPVALSNDLLQRDAGACTTPREEEDVGIGGGDLFSGGVVAGGAEEGGSGSFDELGHPVLGVDEGLAPLFAVDEGFVWSS